MVLFWHQNNGDAQFWSKLLFHSSFKNNPLTNKQTDKTQDWKHCLLNGVINVPFDFWWEEGYNRGTPPKIYFLSVKRSPCGGSFIFHREDVVIGWLGSTWKHVSYNGFQRTEISCKSQRQFVVKYYLLFFTCGYLLKCFYFEYYIYVLLFGTTRKCL